MKLSVPKRNTGKDFARILNYGQFVSRFWIIGCYDAMHLAFYASF